jgi:hypothetical protein
MFFIGEKKLRDKRAHACSEILMLPAQDTQEMLTEAQTQ